MQSKIQQKLASSDGVSIVFGMLFFLIATILSAVMLSASLTAIKSVTSDRKTEQNCQTCTSAASTIRDAITDTTVTETIVTKTSRTSTTAPTASWSVSVKNGDVKDFAENYLGKWLQSLIENSVNSEDTTHSIIISGIEGMEDVTAEIVIKKDDEHNKVIDGTTYSSYDINVVFTTGTGTDVCKLVLALSGECEGESKTSGQSTKTTTTTIKYTWAEDGATIMYGDAVGEAGT